MTTLSVPTTARVIAGLQAYLPGFCTRVRLEYDLGEPYEVRFVFAQPATAVTFVGLTYVADRELLADAVANRATRGHAGSGFSIDDREHRTHAVLTWDLLERNVALAFDHSVLSRFLWETRDICPLGKESLDVDGVIARILEASA